MRRSLLLLALVAGGIVALDRWTKVWAAGSLPFNQPVSVLGQFLRLTYTRNSGVAFGLGQGTGFPYYVFSIAATVAIVVMFVRRQVHTWPRQLALALILGGALGNLWDRIATGEVVDFIEVGVRRWYWPVFNVADSAVTVGVIMFALAWPKRDASSADPVEASAAGVPGDVAHAGAPGPGLESRGATGPVPRESADRPLA
ncbi:MAG TPA: signal peptidase II [Candidatus Eisenbacteria bacterium]|nr:signal peptidase II [Candidatus Eisenbacteria bacterium]